MATTPAPLVRQLGDLFDRPSGVGDAELLDRFVRQRDEAAFELLVWRHQRTVLGVCRRVLRDRHAAEDAFQATFLALVRRARAVRRGGALAAWLHRVAYHVALRVRKERAKRGGELLDFETVAAPADPVGDAARRDLAALLDGELNRLPERYRVAVVLCYLEGRTYTEASRHLGVPVGTLSARLTRARAMLLARLNRRGITLSGAALTAVLSENATGGVATSELVKRTRATATGLSTGRPGADAVAISALAEGALRSVSAAKFASAAAVLLAGLLLASASVLFAAAGLAPVTDPPQPPTHPVPAVLPDEKAARVDANGDALPEGALFRFGSLRRRHDGNIRASALSPDGKFLATSSGGSVVIWDLATDRPVKRFDTGAYTTFSSPVLTFSPDGRNLGYVQTDEFGCVWNVESGKQVAQFERKDLKDSHYRGLCQFTPDGKEVALNQGPDQVIFWDLAANKVSRTVETNLVSLLSPDARTCVRYNDQGTIFFTDSTTGKETGRLTAAAIDDRNERAFAFAPDGKSLVIVDKDREVQVRDFPGGDLRASFPLPETAKYTIGNVKYCDFCVSFSADGRTILLGTHGGTTHRWDLATRKELPQLKGHVGRVSGVHVLPDQKTVITTGDDGLLRRWDGPTGRELSKPEGYVGRLHADYSPDGRFAAVGDGCGQVELWDARTGKRVRVLQGAGPAVTKLAFAPDGASLALALADGTVHFCSVPDGQEQRVLRCAKDQELSVTRVMEFSPDGRRLLISDRDSRACLWDVAAEKISWSGSYSQVAFAPDGRTLIAEGNDLEVLDAATGKIRSKLPPTENPGLGSYALAYSPDGSRFAVGRGDGTVCLYLANGKAEIARFTAVDDTQRKSPLSHVVRRRGTPVSTLAFSRDGRWLCTGGSDGSVRVWEAATGAEVFRLAGHRGPQNGGNRVSFGADGRTVLTCGADAQTYIWSLRPPAPAADKPTLDTLWTALAEEPKTAYRAIWRMSETAGAAPFLRGKVPPVKPVADERLRQRIADLESETLTVREAATKELADLGDSAVPALRKALANDPSPDLRKRLEELVTRWEAKKLSADELRVLRAIDVLERLATAEARGVLKGLAAGADGARPATAAAAALKRLAG